jgi:hypothetical protein
MKLDTSNNKERMCRERSETDLLIILHAWNIIWLGHHVCIKMEKNQREASLSQESRVASNEFIIDNNLTD